MEILEKDDSEDQQFPSMEPKLSPEEAEHLLEQLSPTEINVDDLQPALPPDGGYAWVIVMSSFVCMALIDGMCLSYGILLSELEETFHVSKMKMSLAGSLLTGCYLLMGPVTGSLTNKFGSQTIVIIGSTISTIAIFLSAFLYDFDIFIVVFGIFGGIGYGLMFLPAATVVSMWFYKKRATANGISVCGSGIGNAVYAAFAPFLIEQFTWRGCVILLAAINFHCAIAGALFKPVEMKVSRGGGGGSGGGVGNARCGATSSPVDSPVRSRSDLLEPGKCAIFDITLKTKHSDRVRSTGSLNGKMLNEDNQLIPVPADYSDKPFISTTAIHSIVQAFLAQQTDPAVRVRSQSSLHHSAVNIVEPLDTKSSLSVNTRSHFSSVISLSSIVNNTGHVIDREVNSEIVHKLQQEINRPIQKKDIFYSGSMQHLSEFVSHAEDVRSYVREVTNVVEEADTQNAILSALRKLFDVSMLKSLTFILLAVSSVFAMIGFFIPFQFIKDHAQHMGFSSTMSSMLISVIGATNTVGRLLAGVISDQPWADCLWINNISLLVAGASTMLIPFCTSYIALMACAVVFGLFIASFVSLRTIMVVELLGLDRLTNAYGFLLLFQGIAIVFGPPLLGSVYDVTGVYDYTFYIGGACVITSAGLCLPLRMLSNYEKSKNADKKEKTTRSGGKVTETVL